MNDRLPTTQSATSQANQRALPEKWVEKIFAKFEARYGSLFLDRWRGCNMANVKDTWAEELANFEDKPECIGYALKVLATSKFPPTLPEFLEACRTAPRNEVPALRHVPTADDHERASIAAEKAAKAIKKISGDGIDVHWATHPLSAMQLKFIFEAAKRDPLFQPCIDQMVQQGICTAEGQLLKTYRNGGWYPTMRRVA